MTQPLFGNGGDGKKEVERLLGEARGHFAHRNQRKAVEALHAAERVAVAAGLHGEAAELRRALAIIGSGGRPKLLGRGLKGREG
jgi:hypothetical protein